ncbi:MAG TPA: GNAT family N-acetyltransferase [Vicinamibacterales bacterium]|nr:GNAT family N-acetyltransferase [Vicinamibacterales bacterium]
MEIVLYPSQVEDRLLLPSRGALRIRPLRQRDVGVIGEFYRRLSPRTRYLRFLSPMPDPPDALARLITSVDDDRRLALIAESDIADGAEVVALGECAGLDDHTAEVGFVVQDEWQRQGIGTALAMRTLGAAEARGFDRFVAEMLVYNVGVRRLLDRVGVVVSSKTRRGVSEVTFVRRVSVRGS